MNSLQFETAAHSRQLDDIVSAINELSEARVLSRNILRDDNSIFQAAIYISNGDIISILYNSGEYATVTLNNDVVYNESNPSINYVSSFLDIIPSIYKDYISSNGDLDVNESMQSDSTTYTV